MTQWMPPVRDTLFVLDDLLDCRATSSYRNSRRSTVRRSKPS